MTSARISRSARLRMKSGVAATAFAAALCAVASDADARSIRLGAGEHGAYSRVVVNGAPNGGWSLMSGQDRFDLRLPGADYTVQHSAVTRLRKAHRVEALRLRREGDETVLSFMLNCDCSAAPRIARSGMLIIDVKPRPTTTMAADDRSKEDSGEIETASVAPKTAPLDVDGARAFLMSQLQRAAKQGLIQFKDKRQASAETADPQEPAPQPQEKATLETTQKTTQEPSPRTAKEPAPLTEAVAAIETGAPTPSEHSDTELAAGDAEPPSAAPAAMSDAAHADLTKNTEPEQSDADQNAAAMPAQERDAAATAEPVIAEQPETGDETKERLKDFFRSKPSKTADAEPNEVAAEAAERPLSSPQNLAPQDATTEEAAPKNVAPENVAPENVAPKVAESHATDQNEHAMPVGPKHMHEMEKAADNHAADTPGEVEHAEEKTSGGDKHAANARAEDTHDHAQTDHAVSDHASDDHPAEVTAGPPPPCPSEELLDPRSWPYAEDFHAALSERRSSLFDGLNRVDPEAVAELQKLYLANLMGFEAAAAPVGFQTDDENVALLAALGDAVAERAPAPGSALNRAEPCAGRQAFWQAVALSGSDPDRAVEAYGMSDRALLRVPTSLRRRLGERIALAAAQTQDYETAGDILALLERSQKEPTPALRVVRAELAIAEGRTVAAREELKKVAHSRDQNNLTAALYLAESFSDPYDAEAALTIADLLADFAMQRRGGPEMLQAITAEARLRARYGRLPDAITAIEVSKRYGGYGEEELEALRVALLDDAVAALAPGADKDTDGERKAPRLTSKRRKEQLALAAQLVAHIAKLPTGDANDRIRLDLVDQVSAIGAPHLARLLIDDAFMQRSATAGEALRRAEEAAALIDPLGAGVETGDAKKGDASGVAPLLAELEAAEAKALEKMTQAPEPEKIETDPSLDTLREAREIGSAGTIEEGQDLLQTISSELELIRDLTARQKDAGAPNTAPAAAPEKEKSKGETDG